MARDRGEVDEKAAGDGVIHRDEEKNDLSKWSENSLFFKKKNCSCMSQLNA